MDIYDYLENGDADAEYSSELLQDRVKELARQLKQEKNDYDELTQQFSDLIDSIEKQVSRARGNMDDLDKSGKLSEEEIRLKSSFWNGVVSLSRMKHEVILERIKELERQKKRVKDVRRELREVQRDQRLFDF